MELILGALVIIVGLAVALLNRILTARLNLVTRYARAVASGRYDVEVGFQSSDSLGAVAGEVQRMAHTLARLVEEAKAHQALAANEARREAERSWVNDALRALSERTRAEVSAETLCQNALEVLAECLDLMAGILYYSRGGNLEPAAGYAVGRTFVRPYRLGEGLPGEVARRGLPKLIGGAPGRLSAASGLLSGPLEVVYLTPILLNDEPMGVLELGFHYLPTEERLQFVELACVHLATSHRTPDRRQGRRHRAARHAAGHHRNP